MIAVYDGVDWGGTKIEAIALSDDGRTLYRRRVDTPRSDYEGLGSAGNLWDTIKTASEDVAGGYLRIRDGYQVSQSPSTGPAPPAA